MQEMSYQIRLIRFLVVFAILLLLAKSPAFAGLSDDEEVGVPESPPDATEEPLVSLASADLGLFQQTGDATQSIAFNAQLRGAFEVPPNGSPAIGYGHFQFFPAQIGLNGAPIGPALVFEILVQG